MANYPTGVYSPSAVANGQVIQAQRTNDQDGEISAIEDALLNGIAHNVTFNKSITVSSNLTVTAKTLLSSQVSAPAQPRAMVYTLTGQALSTSVFQGVSFGSEEFDIGGLHDPSSNPDRFTIPTGSSGLYLVGASIRLSTGGAPDVVTLRFLRNGSSETSARQVIARSSVSVVTLHKTVPMVLDAGEFVACEVLPTTSTGSITSAASQLNASNFWCVKLW